MSATNSTALGNGATITKSNQVVIGNNEVEEVIIENEEECMATAIVPDFQLSLAIGKEGQNVRLAAKVSGWKIDIKSHSAYYGNEEGEEVFEVEEI